MSHKSTEELVAEYREAALQQHRTRGTPKRFNAAARTIAKVYRELRNRGEEACLLPLLNHENETVRGSVAARALEFAPELGAPILESLEKEATPEVALTAEMTLIEWRAGRLRFP